MHQGRVFHGLKGFFGLEQALRIGRAAALAMQEDKVEAQLLASLFFQDGKAGVGIATQVHDGFDAKLFPFCQLLGAGLVCTPHARADLIFVLKARAQEGVVVPPIIIFSGFAAFRCCQVKFGHGRVFSANRIASRQARVAMQALAVAPAHSP